MNEKIRYRRTVVTVTHSHKSGVCIGGHLGAKKIDRHHWIYRYETKRVRADPDLAVENTVEACYPCHRAADALRYAAEYAEKYPERLSLIAKSMPTLMLAQLVTILSAAPVEKWNRTISWLKAQGERSQ